MLTVGCKRNEGVQIWRRTRQSRGREGPPLFSSQRCPYLGTQVVYRLTLSGFQLTLSGDLTRGVVSKRPEGPGRLTKSVPDAEKCIITVLGNKPPHARLRLSSASHQHHHHSDYQTPTQGAGRQASVRKWVRSPDRAPPSLPPPRLRN